MPSSLYLRNPKRCRNHLRIIAMKMTKNRDEPGYDEDEEQLEEKQEEETGEIRATTNQVF
jgi:hypothetical protein